MKTRKALKSEYRHLKSVMGVFQIKNLSNGKVWIEGNVDMDARWNRHRSELGFGSHRNRELQKDWDKEGAGQFQFSVLSHLEYRTEEGVNYANEVKELYQLVIEEIGLDKAMIY